MINFTAQEQKFIIFLVITFFLGTGVSYYQKVVHPDHKNQKLGEQVRLQEFFEKTTSDHEFQGYKISGVSENDSDLIQNEKSRIIKKININTAGAAELQTLPRIGPAIAQGIVEYRAKHGPFRCIEDIKNVKKIGIKTFDKIKNSITVK
jgi:comEA protein